MALISRQLKVPDSHVHIPVQLIKREPVDSFRWIRADQFPSVDLAVEMG
jgi:hypothetical protein